MVHHPSGSGRPGGKLGIQGRRISRSCELPDELAKPGSKWFTLNVVHHMHTNLLATVEVQKAIDGEQGQERRGA